MAIVAHIVLEFQQRQTQISYDKLKDAQRDYNAFRKARDDGGDFEFVGLVRTTVDVSDVLACSVVDTIDFDKRRDAYNNR